MVSNVWTQSKIIPDSHGAAERVATRPVRVLLLDLLPVVPYYTGHLSAALRGSNNVDVTLGSATYTHDHGFFRRMGVRNRAGFLDVAYRVRLAALRRPFKFLEYLLNVAALALRFLRSKPDVIHIQFTPLAEHKLPFELWFLQFARQVGIKLVYTVHNVLPHDASMDLASTYHKLYRLMDQFICHDGHAKSRLIAEFGIDPDRISVIPHGPLFEMDERRAASETNTGIGRPSEGCVVLWQGIIRPYKGIPFFLRAWKEACEAGLQAILWIVGTGDKAMMMQIAEDIASLGIGSSVHCDFRFVTVEQLANYYNDADILVYPYSQVTSSGALMTGVGYGKAMIASTLPAFEHVLQHEKNALLAPPDDAVAWASALLRLAADPELRNRLARGLQDSRAAIHGWTEIASQTCRVYEQLLTSPSTRPLKQQY